jgi:hypothetical protein
VQSSSRPAATAAPKTVHGPGCKHGAKTAAPAALRDDDEVAEWLRKLKLSEYLPKLRALGVKCVSDFAELDQADVDSLKLTKFDRKRFIEGLRKTVPNFLLAYDDAGGRPAQPLSHVPGAKAGMQTLAAWLKGAELDHIKARMDKLGIKTCHDIIEMDDSDIKKLLLNKFEQKRFVKAHTDLRRQGCNQQQANLQNQNPHPTAGFRPGGGNQQQGQGAGRLPTQTAGVFPPSVSMTYASQMAHHTCQSGAQQAGGGDTLGSFHRNWRAVQQQSKERVTSSMQTAFPSSANNARQMYATFTAQSTQLQQQRELAARRPADVLAHGAWSSVPWASSVGQ